MCSIGGFIASKPIPALAADTLCTALLYYGKDRGEQSAGIYTNGQLLKKAVDPFALANTDEFTNLFGDSAQYALVHTRQPTCGGRGDAQAQPFVIGDTATVHNGWFLNIGDIKGKWNIKKDSGVDSELVTSFIASYGIMKLPKFLKSVSGAAAFGILHKDHMYLMRDGNPTFWTTLDFGEVQVFVFASTGRMLANSIRHAWLIPNEHPIRETKEGVLFHCDPKKGVVPISQKVATKSFQYSDKQKYFSSRRFPGHYGAWGYYDDTDFELIDARANLGDYADIIRAADITHQTRLLDEASGNEEDESKYDDIRYFSPDHKSDKKD